MRGENCDNISITRVYPLRFNKPRWVIPIYTECDGEMEKTDINLMNFDPLNPRGIRGKIYNSEEDVIPYNYEQARLRVKFPFETKYVESEVIQIITIVDILYYTKCIFNDLKNIANYKAEYYRKKCNHAKEFEIRENKSSEDCPVCLETMEECVNLNCNHRFHINCITQWIDLENKCPLCRSCVIDCEKCHNLGSFIPIEHIPDILNYNEDNMTVKRIIYDNIDNIVTVYVED